MAKNPPDPSPTGSAFTKAPLTQAINQQLPAQSQGIRIEQSTFVGPLPPPDVLEKYERLHKGLVDRIVTMAEKEGDHRRGQEQRQLQSDIDARQFALESDRQTVNQGFKIQRRGQDYALAVVVATLLAAAYFVYLGHELGGGLLGVGGIVALAYVFIHGHKPKAKEPLPEPSEIENPPVAKIEKSK